VVSEELPVRSLSNHPSGVVAQVAQLLVAVSLAYLADAGFDRSVLSIGPASIDAESVPAKATAAQSGLIQTEEWGKD
jgi:hypothetical protein